MQLTDEEEELVLEARRKREQNDVYEALVREALRVASEYEQFLHENDMGSTFSTFCNEFGYDKIGSGALKLLKL